MIKLVLANKPKYLPFLVETLAELGQNPALLQQAHTVWFLLVDDNEEVAGVAYAFALSDVRLYTTILLKDWKHRDGKQAGKDLLAYLQKTGSTCKFEVMIPETSKNVLRYYSRIGYKREGVSRQSARIDDELVDQVMMGYVCPSDDS